MYYNSTPKGFQTTFRAKSDTGPLNIQNNRLHYSSPPLPPKPPDDDGPKGPGGSQPPGTRPGERNSAEAFDKKHRINFHRSYRKLEKRSFKQIAVSIFVFVILVDWIILNSFSEISSVICRVAADVLSTCIPQEVIQIKQKTFIHDSVSVLAIRGRYPSTELSVIVAIISMVVIFLAYTKKKAIEPKMVWLIFIFFITLASSLFFIFSQGDFPYDIPFFSEMYIKTEVGIWLTIPLILTVALLPFPIKWHKKLTVILLTLSYSLVFALVRYIVFLYLLRTTTYLFMALMFFMLGPFLDFIYIVGAYSMTVSKIAVKTKEDQKQWNWLY